VGVLEDGVELDGALCKEGTKGLIFSIGSTIKQLLAMAGNIEEGSTAYIVLCNCYSVYWFYSRFHYSIALLLYLVY